MWIPCFIPLYNPLNLYLIILWILDFKYILLLLLLLLSIARLVNALYALNNIYIEKYLEKYLEKYILYNFV